MNMLSLIGGAMKEDDITLFVLKIMFSTSQNSSKIYRQPFLINFFNFISLIFERACLSIKSTQNSKNILLILIVHQNISANFPLLWSLIRLNTKEQFATIPKASRQFMEKNTLALQFICSLMHFYIESSKNLLKYFASRLKAFWNTSQVFFLSAIGSQFKPIQSNLSKRSSRNLFSNELSVSLDKVANEFGNSCLHTALLFGHM